MTENPTTAMDQFAAKYLLRALQALGVADDSMSESDIHDFASSLRHQMELWIGDEETIRDNFEFANQYDFIENQYWHQKCDALHKKLGIVRPDDDVPF